MENNNIAEGNKSDNLAKDKGIFNDLSLLVQEDTDLKFPWNGN